MQVVVAGGGTAGHIEPALSVADALRRHDCSITVTALGTARGLETTLVPARGYELALIPPVPIPRRLTPQLLTVPVKVGSSVHATGQVLRRVHADVVVGFGGYVAAPAYLAATRARVPIVVHESNPRPGWANRLGARLTRFVGVSVKGTPLPHAQYVGVPIRAAIAALDRAAARDQAQRDFGLDPQGGPVLLVSGGSQGAASLNQAISGAAEQLVQAGVQVLHITGPNHEAKVDACLREPHPTSGGRYVSVSYVQHMDQAYAAADLMVCRSGAMTCAELAVVGLPAVFVPLPHGNGEQALNAAPLVAAGGGLSIPDAQLTPQWITQNVIPLITDRDRLAAMGQAIAGLGCRDADQRMVELVLAAAASRTSHHTVDLPKGDSNV